MQRDNTIYFENEYTSFLEINENSLERFFTHLLSLFNINNFELSVLVCDEEQIRSINHSHRNIDKATDVLSFPQNEWQSCHILGQKSIPKSEFSPIEEKYILGDIIICPKVAEENAKNIGQSTEEEFLFLCIHGILHLLGHDHIEEEEEKLMLEQQNKIKEEMRSFYEPQFLQSLIKFKHDSDQPPVTESHRGTSQR